MQKAWIGDNGALKSILNLLALTFRNWKTISFRVVICMLRAEGKIVLPRDINLMDNSPALLREGITDFK